MIIRPKHIQGFPALQTCWNQSSSPKRHQTFRFSHLASLIHQYVAEVPLMEALHVQHSSTCGSGHYYSMVGSHSQITAITAIWKKCLRDALLNSLNRNLHVSLELYVVLGGMPKTRLAAPYSTLTTDLTFFSLYKTLL